MLIHKQTIPILVGCRLDIAHMPMRPDDKILSVQVQTDEGISTVLMWYEVGKEPVSEREFLLCTTGNYNPDYPTRKYIATVQIDWFVVHIYEI